MNSTEGEKVNATENKRRAPQASDKNHLNQGRGRDGKFLSKGQAPQKSPRKTRTPKNARTNKKTPTPEVVPIKVLTNDYIFLVDASTSMCLIADATINAFNSIIDVVAQEGLRSNQNNIVSVYSFAADPILRGTVTKEQALKTIFKSHPAITTPKLSSYTYKAHGNTPLLDAVGYTLHEATKTEAFTDPDTSFLLYVLTDGQENRSGTFTAFRVQQLLTTVQATGKWTVVFLVPNAQGVIDCKNLGIPEGNIKVWETSERGLQELESSTRSAINSYTISRSRGVKSTASFFADVPSAVNAEKDLTDETSRWKHYTIQGDWAIQAWVEQETKFTFIPGHTFYQLLKKEEVQSYKGILLRDRKNKKIYGNYDQVRALLGIPPMQHVKVEPGNTQGYDIFVESTSNNRRLGHGTQVLVRIV